MWLCDLSTLSSKKKRNADSVSRADGDTFVNMETSHQDQSAQSEMTNGPASNLMDALCFVAGFVAKAEQDHALTTPVAATSFKTSPNAPTQTDLKRIAPRAQRIPGTSLIPTTTSVFSFADVTSTANDTVDGGDTHKRNGKTSDTKQYARKICSTLGCSKYVRYNNACSRHGGRRYCITAGCDRVAQFGPRCNAHGGVRPCKVDGCDRAVQSRGVCKTHGGGVRCQYPGCDKGAISKGRCRTHGGGARCAHDGCQKWAQRKGLCVRHSKVAQRTPSEDGAEHAFPKPESTEVAVCSS